MGGDFSGGMFLVSWGEEEFSVGQSFGGGTFCLSVEQP